MEARTEALKPLPGEGACRRQGVQDLTLLTYLPIPVLCMKLKLLLRRQVTEGRSADLM